MEIPQGAKWGAVAALVGVYLVTRSIGDRRDPPAPIEGQAEPTAQASPATSAAMPVDNRAPNAGKLQITDITKGSGKTAVAGKRVSVDYRGTLTNGKEFDASYKRGQPFQFTLGAGEVIKGWDQGVAGMKVGGKRRLVIPPALGYGASGAGSDIPPNATLIFEVELKDVQ